MSTSEINAKKAEWVIENKLLIKEKDVIIEASMENLMGNKFQVEAVLKTKHKRKIVTGNKDLANAILGALVKIQTRRQP